MLGFSDGTKDGGYFMANWSIYKAKEDLTALSNSHGISVAFLTEGRTTGKRRRETPMNSMPRWVKEFKLMTFS